MTITLTKPQPDTTGVPAVVDVAPDRRRFAGLDGLRAIAVLAVMLFHLAPAALPGGYLGVDIFFVISGFLITSLLLREHAATGRIRLRNFWRRRARRLLPALGLVLLVCCTAAWLIGGDVLVGLGPQVLGAATFSGNWLAVASDRSYFDETTPELFRNLWSLAVEEQFYLLWPLATLAMMLIPARRARLALVGAMAAASAIAMAVLFVPGADATRVYYGTDTHSFGLTIGAALAMFSAEWSKQPAGWSRWPKVVLPLVGLVATAGLVWASFSLPAGAPLAYRGGLVGVAVLSALAILGSVVPGSLLGRGLDLQPLRWIGERSYGLYLWHWPVFVLVVSQLPDWSRSGGGGWAIGGIAFAITVLAAALSYRFVEQPVRTKGFRGTLRAVKGAWLGRWPGRLAAATACGLVVAVGFGTVSSIASDPGRGAAQVIIEQGQKAITKSPAPADTLTAAPQPLPGGDQITAIGDSVMLASAEELQAEFPGIHIDAVVSRQLAQAPQILDTMLADGTLRPTVVIGLGTNGPIELKVLAQLREAVGRDYQIVLVNVFAPRWWTEDVNSDLSAFAQQYRDVELANWRDAIAPQLRLLAGDQIHPGDEGGRVYVSAVRDALQRLSELPPLLDPRDYGLAPLPS